eukprot:13530033-Alexandrium_andersonii.AAC.1
MDTDVQAASSSSTAASSAGPSQPARSARDLPVSRWTAVRDGQWIKGFAQDEAQSARPRRLSLR